MLAMSGEENVARVGSRGVGRLLNLCGLFQPLSLSSVSWVGTSKRGKKGAVAQARATRWPAVEVVWCWWWRAEGTHYSSD